MVSNTTVGTTNWNFSLLSVLWCSYCHRHKLPQYSWCSVTRERRTIETKLSLNEHEECLYAILRCVVLCCCVTLCCVLCCIMLCHVMIFYVCCFLLYGSCRVQYVVKNFSQCSCSNNRHWGRSYTYPNWLADVHHSVLFEHLSARRCYTARCH
jgi:hypothetical protein